MGRKPEAAESQYQRESEVALQKQPICWKSAVRFDAEADDGVYEG